MFVCPMNQNQPFSHQQEIEEMEVMEKRRELHLGRVKWLGRGSGMHCGGAGGFNVPFERRSGFKSLLDV